MPGGVTNTGTHPKLLWPGVKAIWGQVYAEHAAEYTDLFDQDDSDKAYEQLVGLTGYGLAPVKPEGQAVSYDSETQGGITTATHIAYALGYQVTYEEMKDNLYSEVGSRRAKANAFSMNQTIENVAAFIYNNAFVSTYFTLWDSVALCSASHLNVTGGTFSNILNPAAALTEASLEDLTIQMMGVQNDRGMKVNIMPTSLHVAPAEWYNANRILKSVLQSSTSNNAINVLGATNAIPKGVRMNHFFTSNRPWFLRSNIPEAGLKMYWRERPSFDTDNDFATKNALAAAYMRFSVTCGDARAIFGSNAP
jgi:hypothetical protein